MVQDGVPSTVPSGVLDGEAPEGTLHSKYIDFDSVLAEIGGFGKYQKLIVFLVFMPALLPTGFYAFNIVFMSATPADYWCRLPVDGISSADLPFAFPQEQRNGQSAHSRCSMYDLNYNGNLTRQDVLELLNGSTTKPAVVPCRYGWEYDHSVYESTTVTDWNLVCDQEIYATLSFACATVGGLFGAFLWAFLADRFGRKVSYFSLIGFQITFAIASACAPNLIWYCIFRVCIGMCTSFAYTICLLMSIEITGYKTRALMSVICSAGYTTTCLVLLLIAYFIRSWRTLGLAASVPLVALFLLIPVFPESPRWLLAQGRFEQLEAYVRKVARINGVKLDPNFDRDLPQILRHIDTQDHEEQSNIFDLFRTPNLRKKTLILSFANFCNNGIFTGLNLYAPAFGGNPHWSVFLSNLVEFPPYIFARFICDRLGRRLSLFYPMLLCSVFCLVTVGISTSAATTVLIISLVAKFCITITFLVAELYEEEIFPTVVRGSGHSVTSVVSQVAGISAPFVVRLGDDFLVLPLVVFGGLCVIGAATALFLPETVYKQLPQTLEDGELFGKNMSWKSILTFTPPQRAKPKKSKGEPLTFTMKSTQEGPFVISS